MLKPIDENSQILYSDPEKVLKKNFKDWTTHQTQREKETQEYQEFTKQTDFSIETIKNTIEEFQKIIKENEANLQNYISKKNRKKELNNKNLKQLDTEGKTIVEAVVKALDQIKIEKLSNFFERFEKNLNTIWKNYCGKSSKEPTYKDLTNSNFLYYFLINDLKALEKDTKYKIFSEACKEEIPEIVTYMLNAQSGLTYFSSWLFGDWMKKNDDFINKLLFGSKDEKNENLLTVGLINSDKSCAEVVTIILKFGLENKCFHDIFKNLDQIRSMINFFIKHGNEDTAKILVNYISKKEKGSNLNEKKIDDEFIQDISQMLNVPINQQESQTVDTIKSMIPEINKYDLKILTNTLEKEEDEDRLFVAPDKSIINQKIKTSAVPLWLLESSHFYYFNQNKT